jgi:hypothetical protein
MANNFLGGDVNKNDHIYENFKHLKKEYEKMILRKKESEEGLHNNENRKYVEIIMDKTEYHRMTSDPAYRTRILLKNGFNPELYIKTEHGMDTVKLSQDFTLLDENKKQNDIEIELERERLRKEAEIIKDFEKQFIPSPIYYDEASQPNIIPEPKRNLNKFTEDDVNND